MSKTLEMQVNIPASAEQLWDALTRPERLADWFPPICRGEAKPDGKVLFSWGSDCEWETHISAWEPNRHLRWTDQPDSGVDLPGVDFFIETTGEGTTLRLVQSGFTGDSWEDYYEGTRRGWTYFFHLLQLYLRKHYPQPRTAIWRRGPGQKPRAEAWKQLTEALGLTAEPAPGVVMPINLDDVTVGDVAICEAPYVLGIDLPELNHGSLLVEFEPGDGIVSCGIYLSVYGLAPDRTANLETWIERFSRNNLETIKGGSHLTKS
ncbi:MAG: SRPBCC domain-containing protein [Xanthomonadales bacterium]|nr:SRPBCC domain-containing protein [Xanthomonadales bacterium]